MKKKNNNHLRINDFFEFLIPNKRKVISSILLSIFFGVAMWFIIPYLKYLVSNQIKFYMTLSASLGFLIVVYSLMSIICYFVNGEYKK